MSIFFVDCEAYGASPVVGRLTEFGAVERKTGETFHGRICPTTPDPSNPAVPIPSPMAAEEYAARERVTFLDFAGWLGRYGKGRHIFVSDNPAFDWQWIAAGFARLGGPNPFGHSARRIGDFYAGVLRNFHARQDWKRWRQTPHDHNPVNDALGNLEAFETLLRRVRDSAGLIATIDGGLPETRRIALGSSRHVEVWRAIRRYAAASDDGARMEAVAAVERALEWLVEETVGAESRESSS